MDGGAELPEDLIYIILSKLPPCRTEHWAVSCLNQRWNSAVKSLFENHIQPPSIIFPSSCMPLFHSTASCHWNEKNLSESDLDSLNCNWKSLYLPKDVRVHGRLSGSSEGGWFVLALDQEDEVTYQLFNINTRRMDSLPGTVKSMEGICTNFHLEAAVISSSPLQPGYMVAAIGKDGSSVAVRRYSMEYWEEVPCRTISDDGDCLVDLIYYQSQFWFLTAGERIGKLVEQKDENGNLVTCWVEINTRERGSYLSDTDITEKQNCKTKRYLVESEGDLYMVIKVLAETGAVITIKVFRLDLNDADEDRDEYGSSSDSSELHCDRMYFTWEDAAAQFPDRNFFVGQASSRSFPTSSTPRIYFLDDGCTKNPTNPDFYMRDQMGFVPVSEVLDYEVPEPWPLLGSPCPDCSSDRAPPSWWIH
ncbi:unnamed protein product [Alopecurus aequalis]